MFDLADPMGMGMKNGELRMENGMEDGMES